MLNYIINSNFTDAEIDAAWLLGKKYFQNIQDAYSYYWKSETETKSADDTFTVYSGEYSASASFELPNEIKLKIFDETFSEGEGDKTYNDNSVTFSGPIENSNSIVIAKEGAASSVTFENKNIFTNTGTVSVSNASFTANSVNNAGAFSLNGATFTATSVSNSSEITFDGQNKVTGAFSGGKLNFLAGAANTADTRNSIYASNITGTSAIEINGTAAGGFFHINASSLAGSAITVNANNVFVLADTTDGNTIKADALTIASTGKLTLNSGINTLTGNTADTSMVLDGTVEVRTVTLKDSDIAGSQEDDAADAVLNVQASKVLTLSGTNNIENASIVINSGATLKVADNATLTGDASITNSGKLFVYGDATVGDIDSTAGTAFTVYAGGSLTAGNISTTKSITVNGTLAADKIESASAAILVFGGNSAENAAVLKADTGSAKTVNIKDFVTLDGKTEGTKLGLATVVVQGTGGSATLIDSNVSSAISVSADRTLTFSGANNVASVTNNGTVTINDNLTVAKKFTNNAGLTLANNATLSATTLTFAEGSTASFGSGASILVDGKLTSAIQLKLANGVANRNLKAASIESTYTPQNANNYGVELTSTNVDVKGEFKAASILVRGTSDARSLKIGTLNAAMTIGSAGGYTNTLTNSNIGALGVDGSITVTGDVMFKSTGETDQNTFKANIANNGNLSVSGILTADGITNGTGATFTVAAAGTQLNIGAFEGAITFADGATLGNSTFGAGTAITVDATNFIAAENKVTLVVDGTTQLKANNGITAGSIELDFSAFTATEGKAVYTLIDGNVADGVLSVKGGDTAVPTGYGLISLNTGVFLIKGASQDNIYVLQGNEAWDTAAVGDVVTFEYTPEAGADKVKLTLVKGYSAFTSFKDALLTVKGRTAPTSITLLSDVEDSGAVDPTADPVVYKDFIYIGNSVGGTEEGADYTRGNVTITSLKSVESPNGKTVAIDFNNSGADLCLTPYQGTIFTIGDDTTIQTVDGRIWLDYYWHAGTIVVNGNVLSNKQIWLSGAVQVTESGSIKSTEGQICFRPGFNDSFVTITGDPEKTTAQISAATALEFTSGNIQTADTVIEGKTFKISDNHNNSDCATDVQSTNTKWNISNTLTSGESGYRDAFTFEKTSELNVTKTATVGGLVAMTFANGSDFTTGTTLTNSGSITVQKDAKIAKPAETDKASTLGANTIKNKGSISVKGGSTVSATTTLTNQGVILVLTDILADTADHVVHVSIFDGETEVASTTSNVHWVTNSHNVNVVADFGTASIADGKYTVVARVEKSGVTYDAATASTFEEYTYPDFQVSNATIDLDGSTLKAKTITNSGSITADASTITTSEEEGNTLAVTNKAGASIELTGSNLIAATIDNSGEITAEALVIPGEDDAEDTIVKSTITATGAVTNNAGASIELTGSDLKAGSIVNGNEIPATTDPVADAVPAGLVSASNGSVINTGAITGGKIELNGSELKSTDWDWQVLSGTTIEATNGATISSKIATVNQAASTILIQDSTVSAGSVLDGRGAAITISGASKVNTKIVGGSVKLKNATLTDSSIADYDATRKGTVIIDATYTPANATEAVANVVTLAGVNSITSAIQNDGSLVVDSIPEADGQEKVAGAFTAGAITNNGGITVKSGSTMTAGDITNDGQITAKGMLNAGAIENKDEITVNGTLNATTITNAFINQETGDALPGGTITIDGGTLVAAKVINSASVKIGSKTYTSYGTFEVKGTSNLTLTDTTAALTGTVTLLSGANLTANIAKGGTIAVGTGVSATLTDGNFASIVTNNGTLTLAGTIAKTGTITNSGTISSAAGLNLTANGITTNAGATTTISGASISTGNVTVNAASGSLAAANVTLSGTSLTIGTISNKGSLKLNSVATTGAITNGYVKGTAVTPGTLTATAAVTANGAVKNVAGSVTFADLTMGADKYGVTYAITNSAVGENDLFKVTGTLTGGVFTNDKGAKAEIATATLKEIVNNGTFEVVSATLSGGSVFTGKVTNGTAATTDPVAEAVYGEFTAGTLTADEVYNNAGTFSVTAALNATTVTNAKNQTFTVGNAEAAATDPATTLQIGTLSGTINLVGAVNAAVTKGGTLNVAEGAEATLSDLSATSTIASSVTNSGTLNVTARKVGAFTNKAIATIESALTVSSFTNSADATIDGSLLTVTGKFTNSGTITIDWDLDDLTASAGEAIKVISVGSTLDNTGSFVLSDDIKDHAGIIIQNEGDRKGVYLFSCDPGDAKLDWILVYDQLATEYNPGDTVDFVGHDDLVYGLNAFADASAITRIDKTTQTIALVSQSTSYGNLRLNLSADQGFVAGKTEDEDDSNDEDVVKGLTVEVIKATGTPASTPVLFDSLTITSAKDAAGVAGKIKFTNDVTAGKLGTGDTPTPVTTVSISAAQATFEGNAAFADNKSVTIKDGADVKVAGTFNASVTGISASTVAITKAAAFTGNTNITNSVVTFGSDVTVDGGTTTISGCVPASDDDLFGVSFGGAARFGGDVFIKNSDVGFAGAATFLGDANATITSSDVDITGVATFGGAVTVTGTAKAQSDVSFAQGAGMDSLSIGAYSTVTADGTTTVQNSTTLAKTSVLNVSGVTAILGELTTDVGSKINLDTDSVVRFGEGSELPEAKVFDIDVTDFTAMSMDDPTALEAGKLVIDGNGIDVKSLVTVSGGEDNFDKYFLVDENNDVWTIKAACNVYKANGKTGATGVTNALAYTWKGFDSQMYTPDVIEIVGGKFIGKNDATYMHGFTTLVSGGSFTMVLAGGVRATQEAAYEGAPAILNLKYFETDTDVTISGGSFAGHIFGSDVVDLDSGKTQVTFYRTGDVSLSIEGGTFNNTAQGSRYIVGGMYYVGTGTKNTESIGTAQLDGDISLTISGGTFNGYNVLGGNLDTASKTNLGKYATILGNITLTLDATTNALAFNTATYTDSKGNLQVTGGIISAGSLDNGNITGDVKVILTGEKSVSGKTLWGGSTGDYHVADGSIVSNVNGDRILSFEGFTGDLEFNSVGGFNKIEFKGSNKLSFVNANKQFNAEVTEWSFAKDTNFDILDDDGNVIGSTGVGGDFAFDFTGDTVDLSAFTTDNVGWTLNNVTMEDWVRIGGDVTNSTATTTKINLAAALDIDYDKDAKTFTIQLA